MVSNYVVRIMENVTCGPMIVLVQIESLASKNFKVFLTDNIIQIEIKQEERFNDIRDFSCSDKKWSIKIKLIL